MAQGSERIGVPSLSTEVHPRGILARCLRDGIEPPCDADGIGEVTGGNAVHPDRLCGRPQPYPARRAVASAVHANSGALLEAQGEQVVIDGLRPVGVLADRGAATVRAGTG